MVRIALEDVYRLVIILKVVCLFLPLSVFHVYQLEGDLFIPKREFGFG